MLGDSEDGSLPSCPAPTAGHPALRVRWPVSETICVASHSIRETGSQCLWLERMGMKSIFNTEKALGAAFAGSADPSGVY